LGTLLASRTDQKLNGFGQFAFSKRQLARWLNPCKKVNPVAETVHSDVANQQLVRGIQSASSFVTLAPP
jgi:hypothetical protein